MSARSALVVKHEPQLAHDLALGRVGVLLREHGYAVEVVEVAAGLPSDASGHDLVVALGAECSAFDDRLPWLPGEMRLLEAAQRDDVPVLGICFGAQLLARTLGGSVFPAGAAEIGWYEVDTADPAVVPAGPWFQWHFDTFAPPPEAELIATSPVGPQAYRIGRSLGVQFHPETTVELMRDWVVTYPHELREHGVDPDALLSETEANDDRAQAATDRLVGDYLAGLVRAGEGG